MIDLVGGYAMDAYEFGYRVGKKYVRKKDGVADLHSATYHKTPALAVEEAMRRLIRDRVADESITTLSALLEEMNRLRTELEDILEPMEHCVRSRELSEREETRETV